MSAQFFCALIGQFFRQHLARPIRKQKLCLQINIHQTQKDNVKMKFALALLLLLSIHKSESQRGATRIRTPVKKPNVVPKNCPFYGGIFTSVMRRIFNAGFHKYVALFEENDKKMPKMSVTLILK